MEPFVFKFIAKLWKEKRVSKAVDDGVTTLSSWCESLDDGKKCCSTGGAVGQNNECSLWSTQPDTIYEVCENSCNGREACYGVARNTANDSSIFFSSGSCSHTSNSGDSCAGMASSIEKKLKLVVGEGSCSNTYSCSGMASGATNLEELYIGQGSCTNLRSCVYAARSANSLKQLNIDDNQCQSSDDCNDCGASSTFSEALQLTETCCKEETGENNGYKFDTVCQYSEPSSIPSTSNQPSAPTPMHVEPPSPCANQNCNNAGHCKVTSSTEFRCQCENTFINSADGSCVCPPGFVRKNDNRCYDPNTPSPIAITTKAPTSSPNVSNTSAPTSSPTQKEEDEACSDDKNATFYLILNPNINVNCSWLTMHKTKTNTFKRIAGYCDLPRVKTICKLTCSFCTCVDDESFTFELINISNPNKRNKTCNWLTANNKKRVIRIARYCTEDFDNGAVMNACTKSCGLCE